jgi:subfamily B ATP-binding cassette protein MsbA
MNYFKKILRFAKPYKSYAFLNILFNILYSIFNVLSIIIFIPTLGILFSTQEKVNTEPVYQGLGNLQEYLKDSLNYFLTVKVEADGPEAALVFICIASIIIFFLKNLFRYAAMYVLAYLRPVISKNTRLTNWLL